MLNELSGKKTMSNTENVNTEVEYETLYMELEGRYGAALAQDIVDQVKKADMQDNKNETTDYMPLKALSEALEIFRAETKTNLKKLKFIKAAANNANDEVANLEELRLEKELECLLACYWQTQKSFYTLYNRFMAAYFTAPAQDYKKMKHKQETNMAA